MGKAGFWRCGGAGTAMSARTSARWRRNQIRPSEIPWKAASGMTYDSGDFPAVFEKAVKAIDGYEHRKAESKARGKLRGLGIGSYLEVTAPPNKEMGGLQFEGDRHI